jgi:hypothetical protein
MKKLVLMTIASALVWTACGNKNAATNPTATTPSVTTAATTTEPATTTTPAATGTLAEEGAKAMCECAAAKTLMELKKEQAAAGADKAKMAAITPKIMEAGKGLEACIGAVDAKVKALSADEQAKFKTDFEAAFNKQCPDMAAGLK